MAQAIAQGFSQTLGEEPRLFSHEALLAGFKPAENRGRAGRLWLKTRTLWLLGLPAFLLCPIEIGLRCLAPQLSAEFAYLKHVRNLEPELALSGVSYLPGSTLSLVLGWVGTLLITSAVLGLPLNRVTRQRHSDARQNWFGYHIWAGTLGFGCIVLHTAAKLDTWVSLPFWFMIAAVLSGIVGRYLFTRANAKAAQQESVLVSPRRAPWLRLSRALQSWRWIHIAASILFAALALIHIFCELRYFLPARRSLWCSFHALYLRLCR